VGLILDSSVLIAAERQARPISELLAGVSWRLWSNVSAISVIELEHGFWRANSPEVGQRRRFYLDAIFAAIPVQPFTKEMAQLAAKVDAEARIQGRSIPFADLQIGVTALYLDYAVGTLNARHFEMIPGLIVQPLQLP